MKYRTILSLSSLLTLISIVGNVALSVLFCEPETGFMKLGTEFIWYAVLGFTAISGVLVFFMGSKTYRQPNDFVYQSRLLASASLMMSFFLIIRLVLYFPTQLNAFEIINFVANFIVAVDFVILSIAFCQNYEVPQIIHALPSVYFIVNMIWVFMKYSGIKTLPHTALYFLATASCMLFFISYGKVMCDVQKEKCLKRILPIGLLSSFLCLVTGVTEAVRSLFFATDLFEEIIQTDFFILASGIYIGVYTLILFKDRNVHHTIARKKSDGYVAVNSLYVTLVPRTTDRDQLFGGKKKPSGKNVESDFVIPDNNETQDN